MLPLICKRSKKILRLLSVFLLLCFSQQVWAAGPPGPSIFSNPLAVTFIVLMVLLLIIIAILASLLLGAADLKLKKEKKGSVIPAAASMLLFLLFSSTSLFAQAGDHCSTNNICFYSRHGRFRILYNGHGYFS